MPTKQLTFQPLKYRRLSEMIENSIKDLVLAGELSSGTRLPSELDLSRQFGVSVITVREALRGLEAYGLIERKRGRSGGIFIATDTGSPAKWLMPTLALSKKCGAGDFSEVRLILEPAGARMACSRFVREEMRAIEANVDYCERRLAKLKSPISDKDFLDIEERNVEFHRLIAKTTHNPAFYLAMDYVMDLLFNLKKALLKPDLQFSIDCVVGHRTIVDGMKSRDSAGVENAMVEHLQLIENYFGKSINVRRNLKASR
ncbi:MAG: FadR family transcriptional regulator [Chloroflexi bacterium]|nr:FadR family transcriptional regulator [Chloroflexota bacterium]